MKLVDVYDQVLSEWWRAAWTLYLILEDRPLEHGISHKEMPSFVDHVAFMRSRPFRYWLLIEYESQWIGAIECLDTNEFGIHLHKASQGKGFGRQAVELFLSTHEPLPAIPAVRNGHFLANVAPANEGAIKFFKAMGAHKIQETLQFD